MVEQKKKTKKTVKLNKNLYWKHALTMISLSLQVKSVQLWYKLLKHIVLLVSLPPKLL